MSSSLFTISPRMFAVFNFICFQSAWFVAIKWQQQGVILMFIILVSHLMLSKHLTRDLMTIFVITLMGSLIDATASIIGLFSFHSGQILPAWLILLWANFALTFHYSMAWLKGFAVIIQAILGGVFGAVSYFTAHKLGAVNFPLDSILTIFYLIVIWAFTLPVYVFIARTFQGKYYANKSTTTSYSI